MPTTTAVVELAQRLWRELPERRDEALGVLNGFFGDHLERAGSPLAMELGLFVGPSMERLSAPYLALREGPPRACVFVHGLMGTERAWALGRTSERTVEYGEFLGQTRDCMPLYARYNSGRHISINGRALAEQLEAVARARPLLDEITIVAHSMGGLVTRSAMHYGLEAGHQWVERVPRVFLLGAPSHGAPLEQLVHVAAFTLESIWNPWTKAIARVMNLRSAGIKDLRHGFVLDEDWRHRDADTLALRRPRLARMPEHVQWFVLAGALGQPKGRIAWLVGDGLVHPRSAAGQGLGSPPQGVLPAATVRVLPDVSHIALMNDPRVLAQILQWWPRDYGS